MSPEIKERFYNFLNDHELAVISTISPNGKPEGAVIGFGQTEDLELVFGTNSSSRKYKNIQANSNVAFVIGWDNGETIQYEGIARELKPDELDLVRKTYWIKNPRAAKHDQNPGQRHFIVTPSWIRYTDLKINPWEITEVEL